VIESPVTNPPNIGFWRHQSLHATWGKWQEGDGDGLRWNIRTTAGLNIAFTEKILMKKH
jgi:hypothetical protein